MHQLATQIISTYNSGCLPAKPAHESCWYLTGRQPQNFQLDSPSVKVYAISGQWSVQGLRDSGAYQVFIYFSKVSLVFLFLEGNYIKIVLLFSFYYFKNKGIQFQVCSYFRPLISYFIYRLFFFSSSFKRLAKLGYGPTIKIYILYDRQLYY